jgi:TonB family protein
MPGRLPDVTVEGYLETFPGNMMGLWIKVLRGKKIIFEKKTTLTLPLEIVRDPKYSMIRLDGMRGKVKWLRADHAQVTPIKGGRWSTGDQGGYKLPFCEHCTNPEFTDQAVMAKVSGTAVLDVLLDAKGSAAAISVEKPLPCGLTEKAVEAVRRWKFTPALAPDEKPVAVIVPVEVTFRLY